MQVVAKVAHTEPGSQAYRAQDEEFAYDGKPYKHAEPVDEAEKAKWSKALAAQTSQKKPVDLVGKLTLERDGANTRIKELEKELAGAQSRIKELEKQLAGQSK